MSFFGFRGGVHPPENKIQTEKRSTVVMKAPKMVCISMQQHIGAPLTPLVKIGDKVLRGQKIADSDAFMSSPIHSSVSGTVKKIDDILVPFMGNVKVVFIENDEEYTWDTLEKIPKWEVASSSDLLKLIREKGIVGIGGAAFPTHIKLNPPSDTKVDTLLLNGAECEPYLNSDNRLMLENPDSIVKGVKIIQKILGVSKAIIGIEENKPEAIEKMKKAAKNTGIEVVPLHTKYPQGGEKQLIKALTNREVPSGKLPSAVGVVVQNTGTAAAIYEGVVNGVPLIEKIVTVSGKAIKESKNVRVAIGTPFSAILDFCGVERDKIDKLVVGGPMMGIAQFSEETPVVKGTSGVLALTTEETNPYDPRPCISCGKCVTVCPMGLSPLMFAKIATYEQWENLNQYSLMDCIECGSCSYTCPANRPLTESIKIGKSKLREMMKK